MLGHYISKLFVGWAYALYNSFSIDIKSKRRLAASIKLVDLKSSI
jgi:hypothetical protein